MFNISDIMGMDIYFFLNCFFVYSFLGWVFECIVISIQDKTLVNRGFVHGPFCTIYGMGALGVYFLFRPISNHKVLLFFCGCVIATLFEYLVAKLMLKLFGELWWNYDNKKFNYKGILCLESTLCWGLMTTLTFVLFQPMIENFVDIYFASFGKIIAIVVLLIYTADFATSFKKAYGAKHHTDIEKEQVTEGYIIK